MVRRETAERVYERMGSLFTIERGAITCHLCMKKSHHPQDIGYKYCGNCHVYLEDLESAIAQVRRAHAPAAESAD